MYVRGIKPYGDIKDWNVANIKDMSGLSLLTKGLGASIDVSSWDVSRVTNMAYMFGSASASISNTNTIDLSGWDVSKVRSMEGMFRGRGLASGLQTWDISSVTTLDHMFQDNDQFEESLLMWNLNKDVSKVQMFDESDWLNTFKICDNRFCPRYTSENIQEYVNNCLLESVDGNCSETTNQHMSQWDVSEVTDMGSVFKEKILFNVDIGDWDVSRVTSMSDMFNGAKSFNQNLRMWNTFNVINMDRMFFNAHQFDGIIKRWNINAVKSMDYMFYNARRFTDDITSWTLGSNITFNYFLTGADAFQKRFNAPGKKFEKISGMCTDDPKSASVPVNECGSETNVNRINSKTKPPFCFKEKGQHVFNNNSASKAHCTHANPCMCKDLFGVSLKDYELNGNGPIQQHQLQKAVDDCLEEAPVLGNCTEWAISTGFGIMPEWDTSEITNMKRLFKDRKEFNANIIGWNVQKVESMVEMFMNAVDFARDISNWSFKKDVKKENMFKNARTFHFQCEETKCYNFLIK